MKPIQLLTPLLCGMFFISSNAVFAAEDIVVVNERAISKNEVKHFIQKQPKKTSFQQSLQEMINIELLVQQAEKDKMLEDETLLLELKRTRNAIIASEFLKKQISQFKISNQNLNDHYQQHYVDGPKEHEYNANHILVKTEQEANDLIQQINSGAEFDKLAKNFSTGPSGKNGGSLGWFKKSTMVKPFGDATVALDKGKVSQSPIKTQFGWHIIKLNDTREVQAPEFKSVERKIRTEISAGKVSAIIKALRDAASIKMAE